MITKADEHAEKPEEQHAEVEESDDEEPQDAAAGTR